MAIGLLPKPFDAMVGKITGRKELLMSETTTINYAKSPTGLFSLANRRDRVRTVAVMTRCSAWNKRRVPLELASHTPASRGPPSDYSPSDGRNGFMSRNLFPATGRAAFGAPLPR